MINKQQFDKWVEREAKKHLIDTVINQIEIRENMVRSVLFTEGAQSCWPVIEELVGALEDCRLNAKYSTTSGGANLETRMLVIDSDAGIALASVQAMIGEE